MARSSIEHLEVGAGTERVKVGVSPHVGRSIPAGGDGPAQALHRLVRLGPAVGGRETGAGIGGDAGEERLVAGDVVDIDGCRVGQPLKDGDGLAEGRDRLGGPAALLEHDPAAPEAVGQDSAGEPCREGSASTILRPIASALSDHGSASEGLPVVVRKSATSK